MSATRIAVVGVGRFGTEHLRTYATLEQVQLVGVLDADQARAEAVAAQFAVPAYRSLEDLLTQARPDGVSIAVPATHRGALIETVTAHGCAVLIEKPLAADAATATRLAARLDPGRAMVGHVLRFAAPYTELRSAARAIGGPWRGTSSRTRPADHLEDYPSENVVGLTMVHDLDAIAWMTGERIEQVRVRGERAPDGRWSSVDAELTLSGGGSWTCHAGWDGPEADAMSLAGASLQITATGSKVRRPDGQARRFGGAEDVYGAALRGELSHFVDRIQATGTPTNFDLDAAAGTVRAADAVLASLERGGEQTVVS